MENIKLTKEDFISKSLSGTSFKSKDGYVYFFDVHYTYPFRVKHFNEEASVNIDYYMWDIFNGENEFEIIVPKAEPKIVKEWLVYGMSSDTWEIYNYLLTDDEAKEYFETYDVKIYKSTGREWEV